MSWKTVEVSVGDCSWYPLVFITVPKECSTWVNLSIPAYTVKTRADLFRRIWYILNGKGNGIKCEEAAGMVKCQNAFCGALWAC